MNVVEELLRDVLVLVGDINRLDIRLDYLRKRAEKLNIQLNNFHESDITIARLKKESGQIHKQIGNNLQD